MIPAPTYAYLTNINNLNRAWQKVFRKGSVGGIDRISVTEFSLRADAELAHLCQELTAKRYVPEPYMEVKVPKKDNEKRSLGLMTVRDKVVQQALTDALTPFFEPLFLPSSYAYRPNRGVPQAVKRVSDGILHFQNKWVVRCDIDRFFDNIPHELLEKQIRYFLNDEDLIQMMMLCMGMGKISTTGSRWQPSNGKGVAQGGILSPLLANLYLHQLDSFIKSLRKPVGYVRYADDFVVLCREKNLAESVCNRIVGFLTEKLGLTLDEKEVKPISEGFLFLGLWFTTEGYRLNEAKQQELCAKIEETLFFQDGSINPKFFEVVEGIRRYHGQLLAAEEVWFFDNKIVEVAHKRLQEMPLEIPQKTKRAYLEKLDFLTPQYRQAKQQMAIAMCKPHAPIFIIDMPAPPPPPNYTLPVSNADAVPPFADNAPVEEGNNTPAPDKKQADLPKNAPKIPQKVEKAMPLDTNPPNQKQTIPAAPKAKVEEDIPEGINIPHEINPQKLIAQKRREYEKREGASLELVINQPGVSLGLMKNRIMVKQQGQNLLKEPTANVRHISVMARGISLSSNFIQHCAERNIPIVFYDDNKPVSAIFPTDNADSDLWLAQSDAYRNDKAVQIAKTIAEAKITNQGNVLKYFAKHSQRNEAEFVKNQDNTLLDLEKCARLMQELPDKTPMDKLRLQIMAYEGNAAQSYWQQVKELVKDETDFEKREHQGAKDLMNMLLNYGYGILYGRMWSAVMNARLHPSVSYLHTPHKNKPTLVFDMVEEFRAPIVDRTIIALLNRQEKLTIEQGKLSYETRRRLAEKIMERINTIENFRGQRIRVGDIMRLQAVSLAKFLKGETKAYKPYLMKW